MHTTLILTINDLLHAQPKLHPLWRHLQTESNDKLSFTKISSIGRVKTSCSSLWARLLELRAWLSFRILPPPQWQVAMSSAFSSAEFWRCLACLSLEVEKHRPSCENTAEVGTFKIRLWIMRQWRRFIKKGAGWRVLEGATDCIPS